VTLAATNGSAAGNAGGSASVTTGAKTTTASGSGFVLCATFDLARTFTPSDSKSNAYTLANAEVFDASGGFITRFYYCLNGTGGGSHTATGTLDTTGVVSVSFCEITTTNGAGITLDQANQNSDVASPFTSPAVTTLVANEILMSYCGGNSGSNPATSDPTANSFTLVTNSAVTNGATDWVGAIGARVVSSTAAYTASWTQGGSSRTGVHIVTFSEAAGGGGGNGGRTLRNAMGGIGSGGMQDMGGGMQGRARRRSTITVPANFHAFGNRHANHGLRV
jgi:hypothetical protein